MDRNIDAIQATEQLYTLYKDDLYRYIRFTLGDSDAALDIVQEVFIRVLHSWHTFREEAKVKAWLWTIARNQIIDYTRKHKHRLRETDVSERYDLSSPNDDYKLVEIESVIGQLNKKYRQVVILRLLQDWSTADTAKILGWSQAKVRTTLHRAVGELRDRLGR